MSNVILSFPGLGIGDFVVNPVAFLSIHWYGIIITLGMVIAFFYALYRAKQIGITTDDMLDLAIYLIVFCILGARLYYVLFYPGEYSSFKDVIAIWNGGLAIYGGVLAGIATIVVFSKIKKINPARQLDTAAPGCILGQAIGRWGNFCNAEAFGGTTDLPWRMGVMREGWRIESFVHPTFLYESLWNLIGFALIMGFYRKKKFNGQMALFYGIWYGFGRFFIEGMRQDSLMLGNTSIRVSQLVAAICVVGGIIAMVICAKIAKERRMENEDYEEVYASGEKLVGFDEKPEFDIKGEPAEEVADAASGNTEDSTESHEDSKQQSDTEKEN